MRRCSWYFLTLVITLITIQTFAPQCEARGGRGRGGGSFGGIFGGWRKYKKQTSSGNSRRTTNGSPMHTTVTKSMSSGSNSGASHSSNSNSMKQQSKPQSKPQASYPKQQMPYSGYGQPNYASYYGNGGAGAAHLPPGSAYYPNTAAMPQGAIYYAQQPQRSGMGNFLFGMMAGHMLFGPSHHVSHVYQQPYPDQQQMQNAQNNPKVIVVENGVVRILNETAATTGVQQQQQQYWPTDSDTPLEPFNTSVTPADAIQQQQGKEPIFQRVKYTNLQTTQMTQAAQQQEQQEASSTATAPPVNGIICMPIMLNETDPNDPTKTLQIERVLCFPAPPPPSEALIEPPNVNCMIRTFIEADPNDPSQTIEVQKEICTTPTTTLEPPQVAGEIEEVTASKVEKVTTAIEKANEEDERAKAAAAAAKQMKELETSVETNTEGKFIRSLTTKNST